MRPGRGFHLILTALLTLAAGCGAVVDYAQDNELRWNWLPGSNFVSPVRLRVGVLPFHDGAGLGTPEAGINLARLLGEELAKSGRVEVAPVESLAAALNAWGLSGQLTPAQAAAVGSSLRLNAVVLGSVSEINQYSRRKGWRRIARIFTSQRDYVDAVLAVSAVDSATGIVLISRANVGQYDGGPGDRGFFGDEKVAEGPSQEAMEGSLDAALAEAAHRTMAGLAELPFKARVLTTGGAPAIAFGADVGLKPGQRFARLEHLRTVTNAIGDAYQVLGAAAAGLKVAEVGQSYSTLEIIAGSVSPGDLVQAVD